MSLKEYVRKLLAPYMVTFRSHLHKVEDIVGLNFYEKGEPIIFDRGVGSKNYIHTTPFDNEFTPDMTLGNVQSLQVTGGEIILRLPKLPPGADCGSMILFVQCLADDCMVKLETGLHLLAGDGSLLLANQKFIFHVTMESPTVGYVRTEVTNIYREAEDEYYPKD